MKEANAKELILEVRKELSKEIKLEMLRKEELV
jgi:hypothetical protein